MPDLPGNARSPQFASLLDDILTVSSGGSGLRDTSKEAACRIDVPIHLRVSVTPT